MQTSYLNQQQIAMLHESCKKRYELLSHIKVKKTTDKAIETAAFKGLAQFYESFLDKETIDISIIKTALLNYIHEISNNSNTFFRQGYVKILQEHAYAKYSLNC